MLDPKSLPPSFDPDVSTNMQATKLMINVPSNTSHSWYSRVINGRDTSGISS